MFIRLGRSIIAALVALLALVIAQWFDAGVFADTHRRAGYTFDASSIFYLMPVAHLLTAAGVVALALAAWWSRSLLIAVGYAVVGGFLVFLPAMVAAFAMGVNGAPTLAPEPIATTLSNWFSTVGAGPTGAVFTLGAGMLLSGLAVIGSRLRRPRRAAGAASPATAQPSRSEPA